MKIFLIASILFVGSTSFALSMRCNNVGAVGEGSGYYQIESSAGRATVQFFGSGGSVPQEVLTAVADRSSAPASETYFFTELRESRFIIVTADQSFNGGYDLLGKIPNEHSSAPKNNETVARHGLRVANLDCR